MILPASTTAISASDAPRGPRRGWEQLFLGKHEAADQAAVIETPVFTQLVVSSILSSK